MTKITFEQLGYGDTFVYGNNLFTKVEVATRQFNAKDNVTGELWEFEDTDETILVKKAEVV